MAVEASKPFIIEVDSQILVTEEVVKVRVGYNNLPIRSCLCLAIDHLIKECSKSYSNRRPPQQRNATWEQGGGGNRGGEGSIPSPYFTSWRDNTLMQKKRTTHTGQGGGANRVHGRHQPPATHFKRRKRPTSRRACKWR